MPELSIVIPTCNRADLLDRCLRTVVRNTGCDFEVIVVDGASTDHTQDVLADARRVFGSQLQSIREDRREGFVRAANKGFRLARGRHLTWLNDDARPLPNAYSNAIAQLYVKSPRVGLVAMYHRWHSPRNVAYERIACEAPRADVYQLCHVRGTLYANFAVGRREVFEQVGFFDERYVFYAADPDLSLKVWHAGLSVVPAESSYIDHDEHADDRRATDADQGRLDNARLFSKWDLPPVNPARNDFDPRRPCTLRGLRNGSAVAA